MTQNQFFYTIKNELPEDEDGTIQLQTTRMASFNINKVIRSMELPSGELIIILDDFHQETQIKDTINTNTNKLIKGKKEEVIVQSEISLSGKDKTRFFNQTNIEL